MKIPVTKEVIQEAVNRIRNRRQNSYTCGCLISTAINMATGRPVTTSCASFYFGNFLDTDVEWIDLPAIAISKRQEFDRRTDLGRRPDAALEIEPFEFEIEDTALPLESASSGSSER